MSWKKIEKPCFSKMASVSVFDVFLFFIHFLSLAFQVTEGCFSIVCPFVVTPYGNHLILFMSILQNE